MVILTTSNLELFLITLSYIFLNTIGESFAGFKKQHFQ